MTGDFDPTYLQLDQRPRRDCAASDHRYRRPPQRGQIHAVSTASSVRGVPSSGTSPESRAIASTETAEWDGHRLRVVDTGGILPEEKDLIPAEIYRQARVALDEAAAIIMVIDGRTELAGPDLEFVRLLRKSNRPLFLAVNKVDTEKQSSLIHDFHRLGIEKMFPVSAEHARGVDDLLDAVSPPFQKLSPQRTQRSQSQLPTPKPTAEVERPPAEVKVAIIGHPNVGKSTLLNCLTSSDRAIVSPIPGTTRDAVDEVFEHNGQRFRFIDTAGIRRKGKTHLMAEKLSVVMARKHLEAADIALLVIDATEGISQLDAAVAGYAHESGRSMIIIVNKWDLMISGQKKPGRPTKSERMRETKRPGDREAYEERLRYELKFLSYAPVVFISAQTGKAPRRSSLCSKRLLPNAASELPRQR